jgi:hypothetical protein
MKQLDITNCFFIRPVKNHNEIKSKILDSIKGMGEFSIRTGINNISNTDWHLAAGFNRPYHQIIESSVSDHVTALKDKFKYNDAKIGNYWFQQYAKGDYFDWHVHDGCMFSNVYYVDLQGSTPKTTFSLGGEEFCIDSEEGSILTFPSFLIHRSGSNQSDNVKTVISFNVDCFI